MDAQGKIVMEAKVASDREALVAFFVAIGFAVRRIGLEAGPLSQWLHAGLKRAGFETVLVLHRTTLTVPIVEVRVHLPPMSSRPAVRHEQGSVGGSAATNPLGLRRQDARRATQANEEKLAA